MALLQFGINADNIPSVQTICMAVTAPLPDLDINQAFRIDAVDAIIYSADSTGSGTLHEANVDRLQLGFGRYAPSSINDHDSYLAMTDTKLISEMIDPNYDGSLFVENFKRSGIFPQLITRINPFTGREITLMASFQKNQLNDRFSIVAKIQYQLVRVSLSEFALYQN